MTTDTYTTSDLALATTLHSMRCKYIGCSDVGSGKLSFQFEKTEDLESYVKKYFSDDLCISPQKFVYSQKFLKSAIRAQ